MNPVDHFISQIFKGPTSLVILVIYVDLTSKINILLLDLLSQLSNQLHSLIGYQLKFSIQLHSSSVQFFPDF